MTKTEQLTKIRNRATLYEVVLTHQEHRSILVGYSRKKSFQGLVDALKDSFGDVCNLFESPLMEKVSSKQIGLPNGWFIQRSGRTQRDAICNGERPHVSTVSTSDFAELNY